MRLQGWLDKSISQWRPYQISFQKFLWEIKSHYYGLLVDQTIQEKGIKIRWNFRNSYWGNDVNPSICDVQILPQQNGCYAIIFTELEHNTGGSAINYFERLATELYHERLRYVPIENLKWYSHYKKDLRDRFSQVKMDWDGRTFVNPRWGPAKPEDIYAGTRALEVLEDVL